jgi:hypothetical protein
MTVLRSAERPAHAPCDGFGTAQEHVDANLHVAFSVGSRRAVQVFYDQALAAGATSKLAPCLRPEYHPHYYGGFVYDPVGLNIEAVRHTPDDGNSTRP